MLHLLAAAAVTDNTKGLQAVGRGIVYGAAPSRAHLLGTDFTAMARQPESASTVRTTMFLGIAFTEALALFGFVLAFILK